MPAFGRGFLLTCGVGGWAEVPSLSVVSVFPGYQMLLCALDFTRSSVSLERYPSEEFIS